MGQSQGRDFVDGLSEIAQEESPLASSFWCERLHPAEHPMGLLEMNGSYLLNDEAIDAMVSRTSPGNYALGYMDGATFMVFYVGCSDCDVKHRLHEWVGTPSKYERYAPSAKAAWGARRLRRHPPQGVPVLDRVGIGVDSSYTHFAYSYAPSTKAAFEKEFRNYHDFGGSNGLDNERHPAPLEGTACTCPEHVHHHR